MLAHLKHHCKFIVDIYKYYDIITGISGETVPTFCPGALHNDVVTDQCKHIESVYPCTLILLQKENASHGVASLIEACMVQLTLQGVMGKTYMVLVIFIIFKLNIDV